MGLDDRIVLVILVDQLMLLRALKDKFTVRGCDTKKLIRVRYLPLTCR